MVVGFGAYAISDGCGADAVCADGGAVPGAFEGVETAGGYAERGACSRGGAIGAAADDVGGTVE